MMPLNAFSLILKRNMIVHLSADGRGFMSRYLHGFLILLLIFAFSGCGGGEGSTSGDPLGTDSIKVEASVTSLGAGDDSVITATVERLNKQPATDRLVSFQDYHEQLGRHVQGRKR